MAKSSCDGRLCKIVLLCFAALSAIILVTAYVWAELQDAELSPEFPEFRVDLVAVSPCPLIATSSSEYLTATWDLTLVAINPNRKLDLYYENLRAEIFYGDDKESDSNLKLGMAPLPPIYVSKMNKTTLDFSVVMARSYVGTDVANDLIISSASSSCYGSGRLWLKLFAAGVHLSRLSCDLFPPNGTTGQSRACQYFCPIYSGCKYNVGGKIRQRSRSESILIANG
ncbi:unnamed protein product [Malus baccata var. baccata]